MDLGLEISKSMAIFLAGLMGAGLSLRLFLKWRGALNLARARRIAARLRAPATSLAAVEDHSAAVEELIDLPDSGVVAVAMCEVLSEDDDATRAAAIEVLHQTRALEFWRRDLRKGSFRRKLTAIKGLSAVGDKQAIDDLLEALGDDDPDVALAAADAICARDPRRACKRLSQALSSPNRRLAETAAAALLRLGGEATECLLEQLASLNPQARHLAAEVLGSIGDSSLRDMLLPLLGTEPNPEVRAAVAVALAKVDGAVAVEEILRLARSDPDWLVRAQAYSLLAEAGAPGTTEHLFEGLVLFEPDLPTSSESEDDVEAFTEGPRRVRRAIASGLRMLGVSEEDIIAASHNGSPALSRQALDEVSAAASLLRHRKSAQRVEGARRLGALGTAAAARLAAALDDPDPLVRAEAARSLERTGSRDAVAALANCLQDPDASVRLAALAALQTLVTREAAKELAE